MDTCPTDLASKVRINEFVYKKAYRVADKFRAGRPGHVNSMKLIDSLVAADQRAVQEQGKRSDTVSIVQDHIEVMAFFRDLLVQAINWAKEIPQFQNLSSADDQVRIVLYNGHFREHLSLR